MGAIELGALVVGVVGLVVTGGWLVGKLTRNDDSTHGGGYDSVADSYSND